MNLEKMSDIEKILWRWALGLISAGLLFMIAEMWRVGEWRSGVDASRYTIEDAHRDWRDHNVEVRLMQEQIWELKSRIDALEGRDR